MGFCSSSVGIIPAYAGSTIYLEQPHLLNPDHPRIRGEHLDQKPPAPAGGGSSPHTRGAPALFDPGSAWIRIIPAYAGSTITVPFRCCSGADHPRIRGEHDEVPDGDALAVGSSPHTRGAPRRTRPRHRRRRIIPAYAGSTPATMTARPKSKDHPRIRGEHSLREIDMDSTVGSSPHTRGALSLRHFHLFSFGIIPAYAGSTVVPLPGATLAWDHPRIRGEHLRGAPRVGCAVGSSPHTRGALRQQHLPRPGGGIIPAYAGSTRALNPGGVFSADHPRIRGEHHTCRCDRGDPAGIIPAYAGSTPSGARRRSGCRDHPRIRGEHPSAARV